MLPCYPLLRKLVTLLIIGTTQCHPKRGKAASSEYYSGPDVTATKLYGKPKPILHIHQAHVTPCPHCLPIGYYCYGWGDHGTGCCPRWISERETTPAEEEARKEVLMMEESNVTDSAGDIQAGVNEGEIATTNEDTIGI